MKGLWDLARAARQRIHGDVVAITGSSGKTTAREYLQHILQDQGATHAATGSLNNHWGLPLSMARMPADVKYGVFEIGMNHPGEIAPLSRLANPDVALVLNVLPAHIGFFENLDAIRWEKISIAQGLTETGILVLPDELDAGPQSHRILRFGFTDKADVRCLAMQPAEDGSGLLSVRVAVAEQEYSFQLTLGGEHRVITSLAVLAVCYALGCDIGRACESLASANPPAGRGNLHQVNGISLIDDSYNANPASIAYALQSLAEFQNKEFQNKESQDIHQSSREGSKIAILGDMLELGEHSRQMHAELLSHCQGIDKIITVGEEMQHLYDLLPTEQRWFHVASAAEIDLARLAVTLRPGDVVLTKGSNRIFWANQFVSKLQQLLSANQGI